MADDITTIGAEFLVKHIFTEEATKPASVAVGLFDNDTDGLYTIDGSGNVTITESSDVSDVTTEPSDGNYARLSYAFGATDFTSGQDSNSDWQASFAEKEFDLTDTTGYADSFFIVINFNAGADSSATDHMLTLGPLLDSTGDQARIDLGSSRSFFFTGATTIL